MLDVVENTEIKEDKPVSLTVDEQIPFAPVSEPLAPDTVEQTETKEDKPVASKEQEAADSPVMVISQNLAIKFFEMMQAMNVSDQEIVNGFSRIKEQGMKLVMENSHQKENVSVR